MFVYKTAMAVQLLLIYVIPFSGFFDDLEESNSDG